MTKSLSLKGKLHCKKSASSEKMIFFVEGENLPLHEILEKFNGEYIKLELYVFESNSELENMQLDNCLVSTIIKGKMESDHFGDDTSLPFYIIRFTLKQYRTSESHDIVLEHP